MVSVSQSFQQRLGIENLPPQWIDWLEGGWAKVPLAGAFSNPLDPLTLLDQPRKCIWPGFMLPDTLPLIGNAYGDWLCVRATPENGLGEILHWYHGGGDWIPVGERIVEACLHDAVDRMRPRGSQMLRGALESSPVEQPSDYMERLNAPMFLQWCERELERTFESPSTVLGSILKCVEANQYARCLEILDGLALAPDAVACDRIEFLLQRPLMDVADQRIASKLGIRWSPDYLKLLFDFEHGDASFKDLVTENRLTLAAGDVLGAYSEWQPQQWDMAGGIAANVVSRRGDLAWAWDIAGWQCERNAAFDAALDYYRGGLSASSFSDQSVRLRSHWYTADSLKFSSCRIKAIMPGILNPRPISAFQTLMLGPATVAQVSQYWLKYADQMMHEGDYRLAYDAYYRAGWDVGVGSIADYEFILNRLAAAAEQAGMVARAKIARIHLSCFR